MNTAADFLSRLELKVTEKIRLKIREDIKTIPIEVHTSSSDVADEEQVFFTPQDNEEAETEEQTLDRKAEAKNKALRQYVNQSGESFKASVKELIMVRANKAAYAINAIKSTKRGSEQNKTLTVLLKNMKLKILGQKYDEAAITNDPRHKHYKANENRIECNDGILVRKYYNETGHIKTYQILLPKQLVTEMLKHLHGEFGRHPGITAAIINFRGNIIIPTCRN